MNELYVVNVKKDPSCEEESFVFTSVRDADTLLSECFHKGYMYSLRTSPLYTNADSALTDLSNIEN